MHPGARDVRASVERQRYNAIRALDAGRKRWQIPGRQLQRHVYLVLDVVARVESNEQAEPIAGVPGQVKGQIHHRDVQCHQDDALDEVRRG